MIKARFYFIYIYTFIYKNIVYQILENVFQINEFITLLKAL